MHMIKKLLRKIGEWLLNATYEKITVDSVNHKLIRPVDNLVIDGRQYYEFVNLVDMPDSRYVHFLNFNREFNMGLDRATITEYIDKIIKANDSDEKSKIGMLCYMFKDTVNNLTPVESMYNLASLVYFDKDEDLKVWDHDYNHEKIAAFKELPDQAFFFTRLFERGLSRAMTESPEDIAKYLRKSAVTLKAYARIRSELND